MLCIELFLALRNQLQPEDNSVSYYCITCMQNGRYQHNYIPEK